MSLSAAHIGALLEELTHFTLRGVVRKVWSDGPGSIVIELRVPGANVFLAMHTTPDGSRIHLIPKKPLQPPAPDPFVMLLRKHLVGTRTLAIAQLNNDRIVRLDLAWRPSPTEEDPEPAATPYALIAELMGRNSRVLLLDGDARILGSIGSSYDRKRNLKHGERWIPPDAPPLRKGTLPHDRLTLDALSPDGSRSERVHTTYQRLSANSAWTTDSRRVLKRLRKAIKVAKRKEVAISKDLAKAEDSTQFRVWGELLQSAYGKVRRGSSSVAVPNYYAPGSPEITIPLDPATDLQANINRYFKRYRRLHNAQEQIEQRLAALWSLLERLNDGLERAEELVKAHQHDNAQREAPIAQHPAHQKLLKLEEELSNARLLPKQRPQQPRTRRQDPKAAPPHRTFTSKTGKSILVGKGGRHNDTLSLKIACGSDLWLHAHDWAGAHVIVRLGRKEEVDHETLLDAATLAAHYSKGRNDTVVDVIFTRAKHVRKPKGLPPGRVTVAATSGISVRIESTRLERLFNDAG